jgi:hypothetical protein
VTALGAADEGLGPVGGYYPVPVSPARIDEIKAWCSEHVIGDWLPVLGRRILFQRADEAALAALWWYAEEDG